MALEEEGYIYPDEEYESWKERLKTKGELNPFVILFIVAGSIYLMYISFLPILDYFTNGIDMKGLILNLIIFVIGLGSLLGGLVMARHTIIYGRLLDSTFETEIYTRLEPAFEEMAKLRADYEVIYDKLDRMNLYLAKMERDRERHEAHFHSQMSSTHATYTFLMILTLGVLFFIFQFPLNYAPYAFTALFIIWWLGITFEFTLWKVDIAWVWAVLPIFAVPVVSLLLDVIYGIAVTIGVFGIVLVIYAASYHMWARYYLEGITPLSSIDEQ